MKRSTRITTIAAIGAIIAGGALAASSDTGKDYIAQTVDKMTLPEGCFTNATDPNIAAYDCDGVTVKDVFNNKKIASAKELNFTNSSVAGADFSNAPGLEGLWFDTPVDPGSLATAVSTTKSLHSLHLEGHQGVGFEQLETNAKILTLMPDLDEEFGKPLTSKKPQAAPKTHPVVVSSDTFLVLNNEASGNVRSLSIQYPIDTKKLDLSNYKSLDALSIAVPAKANVILPKHLASSKTLKVITDKDWTTYEH